MKTTSASYPTWIGDVVALRWPLTLGNALGYGVLVTGVRLSGT